uniref:Uncharacterized protein n=1 Tax=Anguilla anguilla TaxID=7936 RepID=A0A0E9TV00_ANGAN
MTFLKSHTRICELK